MLDTACSGASSYVQTPEWVHPQTDIVWRPTTVSFVPTTQREPAQATRMDILIAVAARYGVTLEQLRMRGHARSLSWPRQEAMYEMYVTGRFSTTQIAQTLHLKDHTTIIWGVRAYAKREGLPYPMRFPNRKRRTA
jgi:chromosomal replication initiation ATPase DnaA